MTVQEFKHILPQSNLTPRAITDILFQLSGIQYDLTKLRFVTYTEANIQGSGVTLPSPLVAVVLNFFGTGTLLCNGATIVNPIGTLKDLVSIDFRETTGLNPIQVQYALFTFD